MRFTSNFRHFFYGCGCSIAQGNGSNSSGSRCKVLFPLCCRFVSKKMLSRLERITSHIQRLPAKSVTRAMSAAASSPIAVGATIPDDIKLTVADWSEKKDDYCGVPRKVNSGDIFKGKRVVLFGVPGAFTPTVRTSFFTLRIAHFDVISVPFAARYCIH
jgi:hypothetical protein